MKGFKCRYCGSDELIVTQKGISESKVVGITVDDHILANGFVFRPNDNSKYYTCAKCHYVTSTNEAEIIKQLRGGVKV